MNGYKYLPFPHKIQEDTGKKIWLAFLRDCQKVLITHRGNNRDNAMGESTRICGTVRKLRVNQDGSTYCHKLNVADEWSGWGWRTEMSSWNHKWVLLALIYTTMYRNNQKSGCVPSTHKDTFLLLPIIYMNVKQFFLVRKSFYCEPYIKC